MNGCTIVHYHCEECGSIIGEECSEWEGYTSCCNELAANESTCRNFHSEES